MLANNNFMKKLLSLLLLVALAFGFASTSFAAQQYHIVKNGDTMWKISKQYNVPFAEILKLNNHFKNPSMIYPNDRIIIPQTSTNNENQNQVKTEAQAVLDLVNQERKKQGLNSLKLSTELNKVALAKSQDMAINNYFSHQSPTYGSPFEMMKKFGIKYKSAGENIAYNQKTPNEVMQAWMASTGHRTNILNKSYTTLGVGYYHNKGNPFWVQMFIQE